MRPFQERVNVESEAAPGRLARKQGHEQEPQRPSKGAASVLRLQRGAGNAAVSRMLVQRHDSISVMQPVSTVTGTGATSATPEARKTAVEGLLDDSEIGKDAKKIATDYTVDIDWAYNGPGSWSSGGTKVVLDKHETDENTSLIYVHEMHHVKALRSGLSKPLKDMAQEKTKADFVKTVLDEETEGTVLAIETKGQIAKTAGKTMNAAFAMEAKFNEAVKAKVDSLPAETDAAEKQKQGRQAGWDVVRAAFGDGTVVTSNTNETYVVYYEKMWTSLQVAAATPGAAVGGTK
jgi:hypothetical protein